MRKDKVPEGRKLAEGKYLHAKFIEKKQIDPELTQDSLAAALKITQGLVGQYFSGKTNVPDDRMLQLGLILDFDPYELRPSLKDKGVMANYSSIDKTLISLLPQISDDLKNLLISSVNAKNKGQE